MAKESTSSQQGVASFAYNPADSRQPLLFEYARPLEDLGGILLEKFAGRSLTVQQVFQQHHVGKPYVEKNYKDAVILLEESGKVTTTRTEVHRKRGQCPADKVTVTFPEVLGG